MGGGDLNMKKSWHPLTLQNLERVWKAEQKNEAEQKRIAELQQEIKEERSREEMKQFAVDAGLAKSSERVDWLYRGPIATNREEYLLGKRIDKSVDQTLIEEEREKEALASGPGALFVGADAANSVADLEMKIREDPLFIMKKREEEAKKRVLNNPVKMKQLHELLSKDTDKKRHKSSKKRKSRRHSDSDSDDDDERRRKGDRASYTKGRDRSPVRSKGPGQRDHSERGSGAGLRPGPPYKRQGGPSSISRKMDPKELERRRQEMMSLAKSRDKERESKLRKHEADVKKEEEHYDKEDQFLKKLRVQSITSSKSVEDRIHRHINSVQRTKSSMNDFMTRR